MLSVMLVLDLIGYPPSLLETLVMLAVSLLFAVLNRRFPAVLSTLFALAVACLIMSLYAALRGAVFFDIMSFLVTLLGYTLGKLLLLYAIGFIIIYTIRLLLIQHTDRRIFTRK